GRRRVWPLVAAGVLLLVAIGCSVSAVGLGGEAQAGAFVGGGASLLAAILLVVWAYFRRGGTTSVIGPLALARLAARNAGRNSLRSTLTVGLMASATFLIVALSAFRLAPTDAGTGGFQWRGISS